MLMAELHHKLGRDGAGAHERLEDVLTSNVFGLLRYLPQDRALFRFLSGATRFAGNGWELRGERADLHFWQALGQGEIDVLVVIPVSEAEVDVIAVECKLEDGKHGTAKDVGPGRPDEKDQLAKYIRALDAGRVPLLQRRGLRMRRSALVYLTATSSLPREELEESVEALAHDFKTPLYWLGWDSLHPALKDLAQEPGPAGLIATDLRRLLEHKQLRPFEGFGGTLGSFTPGPGPSWRTRWLALGSIALPAHAAWRGRWVSLGTPALPSSAHWLKRGTP